MVANLVDDAHEATELFAEHWQAYDKVLKNDYLSHLVLYGALADSLRSFNSDQHIAFLDLGCGDAHYIAQALRQSGAGSRLSRYTGVDLTAEALKVAEKKISAVADGSSQVEVVEANMVQYVTSADGQPAFDVALTSFAAHHLSTKEKEVFISGVWRLLKPGGVFFVCDAFRRPQESRQEYLDRFCGFASKTWTELTRGEFKWIEDHMREFDIPEPVSVYDELAVKAGFSPSKELVTDKYGNMKVLAFTKDA